jgi:hypothetical protein
MAKSKLRGGAKAHRAKVQKRNENIQVRLNKANKVVWDNYYKWKAEQEQLNGNQSQNNEGISGFNFTEQ